MLSCVTFRQMSYWESDYDLWSHTLEIGEGSFAHNAVAADLMNPDQSMTQHDLRNFDTEQERMDEARRHFERSLELHQQAAEKDPGEHLPEIAMTLISLGTLERLQNRSDEGRQHYEEALKIRRQLARQNPAVYLPEMATTLSNLGTLDLMQNRPDEACQLYEEALNTYRQLAQQNPIVCLPDVAMALSGLGKSGSTPEPDRRSPRPLPGGLNGPLETVARGQQVC